MVITTCMSASNLLTILVIEFRESVLYTNVITIKAVSIKSFPGLRIRFEYRYTLLDYGLYTLLLSLDGIKCFELRFDY